MKTLIGWRTRVIDGIRDMTPHYYREDVSHPRADAISLCKKFYAFRKELIFPDTDIGFCSECEEIASRIASGHGTSFLKSIKETRNNFELVVYFLDGGFAEIGNVATIMVKNDEAVYRLGPRGDGIIAVTTGSKIEVLNGRCVNSVNLKDCSDPYSRESYGHLPVR